MRICISGSHGVGKTTLFESLKKEELFETFIFLNSGARESLERGYDFGTEGLQLDCFFRHMIDENKYTGSNLIADRGIIDCLSYMKVFKLFDGNIISLMEDISFIKYRYDFIFYIPIENEIEEDGVRFCEHREEVDRYIMEYIKFSHENSYTILEGNPEKRFEMAKLKILEMLKDGR